MQPCLVSPMSGNQHTGRARQSTASRKSCTASRLPTSSLHLRRDAGAVPRNPDLLVVSGTMMSTCTESCEFSGRNENYQHVEFVRNWRSSSCHTIPLAPRWVNTEENHDSLPLSSTWHETILEDEPMWVGAVTWYAPFNFIAIRYTRRSKPSSVWIQFHLHYW